MGVIADAATGKQLEVLTKAAPVLIVSLGSLLS